MRIRYKFRMYEGRKRRRLGLLVTTTARIRNHCIAFQKTYYKLFKKYCSPNKLKSHIARLRKNREDWRIVGSQCVQDVIERLDLTFQSFFKWAKNKKGRKQGFPKFKKSAGKGSITFKQAGWAYLGGNRIRFGKYQYKFIKSREIEGKIKTCTLKRDSLDRLWVSFSCEKSDKPHQIAGSINTAGFDFGLKTFLTCSDGTTIESPQFFKTSLAEIALCGRDLTTKKEGSRNRLKAKRRLTKAYERITDRRRDWFFKLAHTLCDRFDVLYFETLNLEAMKKFWGRKVSDLAFHNFLEILKWVASKRGKQVRQIGSWEPTTKTCSMCGHKQNMPLALRVFDCGGCGRSLDRDLNAALNIKRLGHQADGLGDVSHGFGCAVPV